MRKLIGLIAIALAGCVPPEPRLDAVTPSMVSLCARPEVPLGRVVEIAQAQCARNGRSATLIHRDLCSGAGITPSTAYDFRCE